MIGYIWAESENGVIGDGPDIPWENKTDRRFYVLVTKQGDILHGRTTHETLPNGSLPDRHNLVLTRNRDYVDDTAIIVHNKKEVMDYYINSNAPLFISGGAIVFEQFLNEVTHLYRTIIHADVDGDVCMPEIDYSRFTNVWKYEGKADHENQYDYTILIYKRNDLLEE